MIAAVFYAMSCLANAGELVLWYQRPADISSPERLIDEALPIGNGQMGALIVGAPGREGLVLNEDSLWTGDENLSGNYDTMGAYQMFASLFVNLPSHRIAVNYQRDLNLDDATAHVSYESGKINFRREFFCSKPDGVLVARFTANRPSGYSGSIELADSHGAKTAGSNNILTIAGALGNGLKYEAQLMAVNEGGSMKADGATISFTNCNALTIFVAMGTDYAMDYTKNYSGENPHGAVAKRLQAASAKGFNALKAAHIKDYQALFNRVTLNLGRPSVDQVTLPTNLRKAEAAERPDGEFEETLFQYGRYLMISCSRPGGLPANLQGLWNDSNKPEWHSDYHTDINIQMNYWPAETANMAECHLPLCDLVASQIPAWRKATARAPEFKTPSGAMTQRGWAVRVSHNIFGGMGWEWDKTANAWYCQDFWEHYEFTGDREFLKNVAYPIMHETCEFWVDHLKKLPDGKWVVPQGWSPEHGPVEDGVNYNQEIVWDLFDNFVHASAALGEDRQFRETIAAIRDHLAAPGIGSWGQLLEWMHEKHDPKAPELDTQKDHHRHTSHLVGLYPGHQIDVRRTPDLAWGAKISLDARDIAPETDVREWSFAWRCALYARLHDGVDAHTMLRHFLENRNSCINLFGTHPPMQIDGNFGITAAIAEMLLQSQGTYTDTAHPEAQCHVIELLPALPPTWPRGSVKGLRARGGFQVDMTWDNGQLVSATIHSDLGSPCRIAYYDKIVQTQIGKGKRLRLNGNLELN